MVTESENGRLVVFVGWRRAAEDACEEILQMPLSAAIVQRKARHMTAPWSLRGLHRPTLFVMVNGYDDQSLALKQEMEHHVAMLLTLGIPVIVDRSRLQVPA